MDMLFVGLIKKEYAKGKPTNCMSHGSCSARSAKYSVKQSINIDGPCCQRARLAVDHADVQKTKMNVKSKDLVMSK